MPITMKIEGIDALVSALSSLPSDIQSGVKVTGSTNYIKAMVWDLGYVTRTIKPGPKTMWSVNVYGDPKVLTITAPTGFIRINRAQYASILSDEFSKCNFSTTPIAQWPKMIEDMMSSAARRCSEIIAEGAPIDTGDLRQSIEPALPDDSVFTEPEAAYDVGSWLE